jgi:hypothetical protein
MAQKCAVKMGDKVSPLEGSSNGETGTCPTCLTPGVVLSVVGGYIRAHVIADREVPENNPKAPTLVPVATKKRGTGLSEPVVTLTDTGLRIGDPRGAERRRVLEIESATGTGTVQVPRRVQGEGTTKSGKPRMVTKMVDVPATEEHVREALDYWRKRRVSSDAGRKRQNDMITSLARRLEAIMAVQEVRYNQGTRALDVIGTVPVAQQQELSGVADAASAHRGPTLVPGRDVAPRLRDPERSWDEGTDLRRDGTVRKATTLDQPRGRDRFDRKITDVPEPKKPRTAGERRRYRREQAQLRKLAAAGARQSNGKRA